MVSRLRHSRVLGKEWSLGCVKCAPAARGGQDAGITQPRDHSLAYPCLDIGECECVMLRAGTNGNSSKLTTTLSVSGTRELLFSGRLWKPLNLETEPPSSRAELPLSAAAPVFDLDTNWTVRQLEKTTAKPFLHHLLSLNCRGWVNLVSARMRYIIAT